MVHVVKEWQSATIDGEDGEDEEHASMSMELPWMIYNKYDRDTQEYTRSYKQA
jgi:hypothetical protein